jgi:hydroxyacyl-ACP dehydratase HTD2-like protein with hotdog domain
VAQRRMALYMNSRNKGNGHTSFAVAEAPWYDKVEVVDTEWIKVSVTTSNGDQVHYRIPRRTWFHKIDQATR